MARVIKEEAFAARRNEILDAAQRFVYMKGYEQMTIQDILDALKISKGAFYHYFDSKPALLEALIQRIVDEAEKMLTPLLQDPQLPALEKIERFFITSGRWKTDHKAYLLSLLHVWYADDNAIVRQKTLTATIKRFKPLLAAVVHQGIQEGIFSNPYPDQVAETIFYLIQGMGDTFVEPLLRRKPVEDDLVRIERAVAAYTNALERILGVPSGSLHLMDKATIQEWISLPERKLTEA